MQLRTSKYAVPSKRGCRQVYLAQCLVTSNSIQAGRLVWCLKYELNFEHIVHVLLDLCKLITFCFDFLHTYHCTDCMHALPCVLLSSCVKHVCTTSWSPIIVC